MFPKIIKDGHLNLWVSNILFFGGLAGMGAAIHFLHGMMLYFFATIGLLIATVAGLDSKAKVLGIKPFTRDPLGWRQAKATYKSETDSSNQEKVTSDSDK